MACDVQAATDLNDSSGSSRQITITNVKNGHAVLLFAFWKGDQTISSVVDNAAGGSNTYADSGAGRIARPTDGYVQCLGAKNVTGGNLTLTVTWNGSVTSIYLFAVDVLQAHASTLFGQTASGTATSGTSLTTGSFTPSYTRGMILAFGVWDDVTTMVPGNIGGILSRRVALPSAAGMGIAGLSYDHNLGSGITAACGTGGAGISKGVILAVEIQAATAVYASQTKIGIRNDGCFLLNNTPTFLRGFTYFDALDWWYADLLSAQATKRTHPRILLSKDWDDGGTGTESVFNSDGTLRDYRMARIHALIQVLDQLGMACEVVIHVADGSPNTATWITNATNRAAAVTNAVAALKSHTNVFFDIVNEPNYDPGGSYTNFSTQLPPLANAALTEYPTGVLFMSPAGGVSGQPWGLDQGTEAIRTTDIDNYVSLSLPVFGYHEGREGDWWMRTGMRGNILRTDLDVRKSRPDMPIYFNEPARVGSIFAGGSDPTGTQLAMALVNGFRSRLAGQVDHSDASFDLSTATMVSQFTAEELIGWNTGAVLVEELSRKRVNTESFPKAMLAGR